MCSKEKYTLHRFIVRQLILSVALSARWVESRANSTGNRNYYYTEPTASSPLVAVTFAGTNSTFPQKNGHAELAWVAN